MQVLGAPRYLVSTRPSGQVASHVSLRGEPFHVSVYRQSKDSLGAKQWRLAEQLLLVGGQNSNFTHFGIHAYNTL